MNRLPLGFNGVDVHADPSAIPDGKWQRLRNLAPLKSGILGTRPSLTFSREVQPHWRLWNSRLYTGVLGEYSGVPGYWSWAQFLRPVKFMFDPNFGHITMIAVTSGSVPIYRADAPGVDVLETVAEGMMLLVTLPGFMVDSAGTPVLRAAVLGEATRQPSLFSWFGTTYAFAGKNAGRKVVPVPDPTLPLTFSYAQVDFGAQNNQFHPDGAAVVRDRVLYYKGQYVWFSDKQAPEIISSSVDSYITRRLYIAGGDETEDITAVAEIGTTADGSPVQSVAMVWTRTAAYMLLGEPVETDIVGEAGDLYASLQGTRLNIQCGCVSQATIKRTPYGTFWVGPDDVWFMPFGSLPIRVGTAIRPLLEAQPRELQWKIHAEYADGFYRVSLFSDGQGPSAYSPCGMQMWLDLRKGAPRSDEEATWFGPHEFVNAGGADGEYGVYCMAKDDRPGGDGRLYALQAYEIPDNVINSEGMSLCTFDGSTGVDCTAPVVESQPWRASTAYAIGDVITARIQGDNGEWMLAEFTCDIAGTSGSVYPTFSPIVDLLGRVVDGSVIWLAKFFNASSGYVGPSVLAAISQTGASVLPSMLSKELFLGDPMTEKLLDGAELGYWVPQNAKIAYNSHAKQDSTSRILYPAHDQTANNTAGSWTGDRVWQTKLLTATPGNRFRGKSAVWELGQTAGIFLTEGVDDALLTYVNAVATTLTLPTRSFDDIGALITALNLLLVPYNSYFDADEHAAIVRLTVGVGFNIQLRDCFLTRLLGFDTTTTLVAVDGSPLLGLYSPPSTLAPPLQFSGLNLRYKIFNRRPQ